MADFQHLAKLRVQDDATAEFTFFRIVGEPTLTVRHAGDTNPDFLNAVLKKPKRLQRAARRARQITAASIDSARMEDIQLFARCIVVGWSGVLDSQGEEVEFTRENLIDFLTAIPPDMFNELRAFCLDIENFREESDMMDAAEEEELQGN